MWSMLNTLSARPSNMSKYHFSPHNSCNISNINSLNGCKTSYMIKEIGQFDNSSYWGIEMKKARQLYLGTYSSIDSIDHLIKTFRMKYRFCKYWHSTHDSYHLSISSFFL